MEKIFETFSYIFSEKIFLGIFGWCVNPVYNNIARSHAPIVADVLLFLVECLFYGLVIALIVKLSDLVFRKRKKIKKGFGRKAEKRGAMTFPPNNTQGDIKETSPENGSKGYREYK